VIGTSNRLPSDLYQQGIQQEQFQSFLGHLQARCPVYELRSQEDWRRRQRKTTLDSLSSQDSDLPPWALLFEKEASWFTNKSDFETLVANTTEEAGSPKQLIVYGRPLPLAWQVEGQAARFKFADLCEQVGVFSPLYIGATELICTLHAGTRTCRLLDHNIALSDHHHQRYTSAKASSEERSSAIHNVPRRSIRIAYSPNMPCCIYARRDFLSRCC
jgi:hypothetical protein